MSMPTDRTALPPCVVLGECTFCLNVRIFNCEYCVSQITRSQKTLRPYLHVIPKPNSSSYLINRTQFDLLILLLPSSSLAFCFSLLNFWELERGVSLLKLHKHWHTEEVSGYLRARGHKNTKGTCQRAGRRDALMVKQFQTLIEKEFVL